MLVVQRFFQEFLHGAEPYIIRRYDPLQLLNPGFRRRDEQHLE